MSAEVVYKLLAIMATVALGWLAAQRGWLGRLGSADPAPPHGSGPAPAGHGESTPASSSRDTNDPAMVISNLAFYLFVPALLFRTMVRQDLGTLPWHTLGAYFAPAVLYTLAVYTWQRRQPALAPAGPATRSVAAVYGNAVQLGIPMATALFGESGLALHIALVSVHGLVLLTLLTVLVEADLARHDHAATRWATLRTTVRNTVVHPVVLPVLLGLLWNFTGLGLHPVADQALQLLGSAVVPVCLVLIGVSLATYGLRSGLRPAAGVSVLKLLVLPALVLAVAWFGFGLRGTALGVLVMMAALPVGNNALIFAQRYRTLQPEATVAIVVSTVAFMGSAALWLAVLGALPR